MQLVGAHNYLIRRPFLIKGVTQGIVAAVFAMILLVAAILTAENQLEGLFSFQDFRILGIIFAIILVIGVLIAWFSTLLSVNKYLNMKTDNLYT
jgi:cell division transport system permease protein